MQCPILTFELLLFELLTIELFEMVILLLDVTIMQQGFISSYLFNNRHTSISIVFILCMASKMRRQF